MLQQTVLYTAHQQANAKLVDFAGFAMPLHYGSQLEEHHFVRQDAGMFDVSHMGVIDVFGQDAKTFLRHLLANDVEKLTMPGKALYSCMLNEAGGIIDDLIVYFIHQDNYRVVVNAGTKQKDIAWIKNQAQAFNVDVIERHNLAIIAIQGPNARAKTNKLFAEAYQTELANLKPFQGIQIEEYWVARTGYTGEDGYEIIMPKTAAQIFWQRAVANGIKPCGLGARDTLRLEAGLNLYGNDMDETITPLEANLAWTVLIDDTREFIGKKALQNQLTQGIKRVLVGLILEDRGVLRAHQTVQVPEGLGEITSGTFSPTLGKAIAFARIPTHNSTTAQVLIRDKWLPVKITKTTFVRNGKSLID